MYQKLLNWSEKNWDKLLHLIAGAAIGASGAWLVFRMAHVAEYALPVWCAIIPVVVCAAGKELWDLRRGGLFNVSDFIFTVVGGALITVFAWLIAKNAVFYMLCLLISKELQL